jgi:hypothetical protein
MAKRQFLSVRVGHRCERLFIDDLVRVHKRARAARPCPPKYCEHGQHDPAQDPSSSESSCESLSQLPIFDHQPLPITSLDLN